MFRRRRARTALVAAAGLGGIAATTAGDTPPAPLPSAPSDAPSATNTEAARGLAARLSTLPAAAVTRLAQRVDPTATDAPRKRRGNGFTVVHVKRGRRVSLRVKPRGKVADRVGPRTPFGSRQTLGVAKRRGRWLGVTTPERPNGKLAWVDGRAGALGRHRTRLSLHVDLSRQRLQLRSGNRTLRSAPVGIGAKGSPTPTGRFAVTDKLSGSKYGGTYGCCIVALSGNQEKPPPGWRGGTRLAIHGTSGRSGAFSGASAGCVSADGRTLRLLMRRVPLGTPVFVSR